MANSLSSNFARKIMPVFLEHFMASRVLTKTVDTQLFSGKFNPSSGDTVDIKRPHDFRAIETSDGDLTSETKNSIVSGKASATVQDYITVPVDYTNLERALELNQLDEILAPAARRMVTQLELNLGAFMQKNLGLSYGTPGTAVDAWSDVAGAGALMETLGVPSDDLYYVMSPFTQTNLAAVQSALASGKTGLVDEAWQKGLIAKDFAGMKVMASNAIKSRTSSDTGGDRVGAVAAAPTSTYAGAKDTMTQSVAVDGFTSDFTIKAGEIVEITGKYHLSLSTREIALGANGAPIKFRGVVTADAAITSGSGTLVITGPAIQESNGQYNTIDTALADGDVVTILGADDTVYQPSLFYHKQAIALATVKLPKLDSKDTVATTSDGFSIRLTRDSDSTKNTHSVRFDLLPAMGVLNPFFGGQGYGA